MATPFDFESIPAAGPLPVLERDELDTIDGFRARLKRELDVKSLKASEVKALMDTLAEVSGWKRQTHDKDPQMMSNAELRQVVDTTVMPFLRRYFGTEVKRRWRNKLRRKAKIEQITPI